jgi:methylated-DNA-[protein]-cysteine S-methyltransferase
MPQTTSDAATLPLNAALTSAVVATAWWYLDMPTPLGALRIAMRAPSARSASRSAGKNRMEAGGRSPEGLAGAWFVDDQKYLPALTPAWEASPEHPFLKEAQEDIQAWFEGERAAFKTVLSPSGTPFQEAVWQGLLGIPYGDTESYAALTHRIGCPPTAVRAVAGAVGRNPISVLIPCHRVIGSDGALTGYAGGLPRKQFLLRWEQSSRQTAMPFSLQP